MLMAAYFNGNGFGPVGQLASWSPDRHRHRAEQGWGEKVTEGFHRARIQMFLSPRVHI